MRSALGSAIAVLGLLAVSAATVVPVGPRHGDHREAIVSPVAVGAVALAIDDLEQSSAGLAVGPRAAGLLSPAGYIAPSIASATVGLTDPLTLAPKTSPPA